MIVYRIHRHQPRPGSGTKERGRAATSTKFFRAVSLLVEAPEHLAWPSEFGSLEDVFPGSITQREKEQIIHIYVKITICIYIYIYIYVYDCI